MAQSISHSWEKELRLKLNKMLTGCKGFQRSTTELANVCYLISSRVFAIQNVRYMGAVAFPEVDTGASLIQ